MSADERRKSSKVPPVDGEADDTDAGEGGQAGQIEFRDFVSGQQYMRDDQLSSQDVRRLLQLHEQVHKGSVIKQEQTRAERERLKRGEVSLSDYRHANKEKGVGSRYDNHPILSKEAQFSGDRQVNALPTENNAETNEKKKELVLNYDLKNDLRHKAQPHATPKPRPL